MNLSAENELLLRRWVTGELTRREEAELEARAREDDFLAEALAGLRRDPATDHAAALAGLRDRLDRRVAGTQDRDRGFGWRRLAAAVLLLLVAGGGVWFLTRPLANTAAMADAELAATPAPEAELGTAAAPVAEPESEQLADAAPIAESAAESAETTRAPAGVPAPRREIARSTTPVPSNSAAPAAAPTPSVATNVPPAVLPEAYDSPPLPAPPPPPPAPAYPTPATAGMTLRSTERARDEPPPPAPADNLAKAAPVPYSVGAQKIAADTPNSVPMEAADFAPSRNQKLATAPRSTGQARTVRGYVRDADSQPLSDAMVTTPGVPVGMYTDSAGYFELRIDRSVDRLLIRNTGYADEEVPLADDDNYVEVDLAEEVVQTFTAEEVFARQTFVPGERPTMVAPPGGHSQLRRQLRDAKPANLPGGRVRLEFTISDKGKLRRFRVLDSPDPRLAEWLIERLQQSDDWIFYHGTGPHTVRYSVKFD